MTDRPVIALLRVSSEAQAAEGRHGLPAQRDLCERIARAHDLQVTSWVALDGVSGAAVLSDPRFIDALERVHTGQVCGLVVADADRLFRRGRFADFAILDAFADSGALIYTSEGVFDMREDAHALLSVLRHEIGGQERRRIAERTRRGRERVRRLQGIKAEGPVGIPRGVTFDYETNQWGYDFPEAERVREVFRLWLQSDGTLSFAEIARRAGLGAGSASNRSWAVRSALKQPLYMGVYRVDRCWVRTRGSDGRERVVAVPREPEDCYEHQVLDPPLVSSADWHRAQELLGAKRATKPPRRDPDTQDGTYSGFVDCADCGSHVWTHPGSYKRTKHGPRWQHAGYHCGTRGCATGFNSVRTSDPKIDAVLQERLGSAEVLERLIHENVQEHQSRTVGSLPTETSRRLTELANQRQRAKDAYMAGVFDLRELQKRVAAIEGEEGALKALQTREGEPIDVDQGVVDALVDVFASWSDLGRHQKRALMRDFRIRVAVRKGLKKRGKRAPLEVRSVRLGVFRDDFSIYN